MKQEDIIFVVFAGREKYMRIQQKQLQKIFSEFDRSELHLWNFSRNESDNEYLQNLSKKSSRITIFNQFYEGKNDVVECIKRVGVLCGCQKCRVGKWSEPYKYYASSEKYKNSVFVKIDDDVLFIDHKRISAFIDNIRALKGGILSAEVVNNGVCAALNESLRTRVFNEGLIDQNARQQPWWWLCTKAEFFELSHKFFFECKDQILSSDLRLRRIPRTRFSINTIGFDWSTMRRIAESLMGAQGMNDEGIISEKFDITVLQGFISCHLHFSDQRSQISDAREASVLDAYDRIAGSYT